MMTLFWSPTSPYVRKVLVTAHELGIADHIQTRPTVAADEPEALLAVNPAGKVPVLVGEDGAPISDSSVICAFLEAEFGAGRLTPADGPARWAVLTAAARASALVDAGILVRLERARPEGLRSEAVETKQLRKVTRSLDAFEAMVPSADPFDAAGIALATGLGWLLLRLPEDRILDDRPRLAAWFETVSRRPSMEATVPPAA